MVRAGLLPVASCYCVTAWCSGTSGPLWQNFGPGRGQVPSNRFHTRTLPRWPPTVLPKSTRAEFGPLVASAVADDEKHHLHRLRSPVRRGQRRLDGPRPARGRVGDPGHHRTVDPEARGQVLASVIVWEIVVTNAGPSSVSRVTLEDERSDGLPCEGVEASSAAWRCTETAGTVWCVFTEPCRPGPRRPWSSPRLSVPTTRARSATRPRSARLTRAGPRNPTDQQRVVGHRRAGGRRPNLGRGSVRHRH